MQGRSATLTDIANKVLHLLGEDSVTDISSPDTAAGKKLAVFLYDSIDEVQGSFYWHELIATEEITADATDHFDGRKRYALPANCLRPLGVRDGAGVTDLPETTLTRMAHEGADFYDVEANWLLTYGSEVEILYIKREDDPTQWTAELQNCVIHAAAANSAQAITDDPNITRNALEKYERLVRPRARRLQSKYKTNEAILPRGFRNLHVRMA